MAIEFLGSKGRLLNFVLPPILELAHVRSVADPFCGTAAVSHGLGAAGRRVIANDQMALCATLAEAALLAPPRPAFTGLAETLASRPRGSMYETVLLELQLVPPLEGFIHDTYSPAAESRCGVDRRYFTRENAAKIDAIRAQVAEWEPLLTRGERAVLLRDLVVASSRVSNTAGTYGCFLRNWKRRALEPLQLRPWVAPSAAGSGHEVHCGDASDAAAANVDAVYLDPPYTKRQYSAYYHVLETIVEGDCPEVQGVTGLRPWRHNDSNFCHRRRAGAALNSLVESVRARHVFLSYSDEGHIPHEEIVDTLRRRGSVTWSQLPVRRYRSNVSSTARANVYERLYALTIA